ncbi:unnamed protein product, partial [Rotaria magnacalcarata]
VPWISNVRNSKISSLDVQLFDNFA